MFQNYLPGDIVTLVYSDCGLIHGTAQYTWVPRWKMGVVVGGEEHSRHNKSEEIEILVLIDGNLLWIESSSLEKR